MIFAGSSDPDDSPRRGRTGMAWDSSPAIAAKPCSLFVLVLGLSGRPPESGRFTASRASARRPISRVLYRPRGRRWPFLWDARCRTPRATYPGDGAKTRPTDGFPKKATDLSPLHGLAPGGVCRAATVAGRAVRSYRTLSPLPDPEGSGGLLSVALSLGSPPPGVTRHRVSVEPGLSSLRRSRRTGEERPSGRLAGLR